MQRCRCFAFTAAMALLLSAWAHAEGNDHWGQGYVFFAPGGLVEEGHYMGTATFGGGGEVLLYKGIGAGADLGYMAPWRDFSAGIGLLSANGSYHFMRNSKVSPFVAAGYSLGFREGHANLFNFGGGAHWWISDRFGLRMEFRDHVYSGSNLHFLEGRIGLSIRQRH
jgi:hypothetical protein